MHTVVRALICVVTEMARPKADINSPVTTDPLTPPSMIKSPLLRNDHSKDPSTPRQKVRKSLAGSGVALFLYVWIFTVGSIYAAVNAHYL